MNPALTATGVALRSADLIALRAVALQAHGDAKLASLPGGFATRRRGHGLEVADIREYVPGDDLRHLDRGTTARTGRLHVRQFQEERDRVSILVADFRAPMFWGLRRAFLSVAAAEVLALIGWNVVENGGRVGLLAITPHAPVIVPPRGRARGMLDVIGGMVEAHDAGLKALAAGGHDAAVPLDQTLARLDRIGPAGAELFITSGFDTPGVGLPDRLRALARRRVPQLVLITDADVGDLPQGLYPIRLPDGRFARVALTEDAAQTAGHVVTVAGQQALRLRAGLSVEQSARLLAAAFPVGQAA